MKRKLNIFFISLGLLLVCIILTSCGKKNSDVKTNPSSFQLIYGSSSQPPQLYYSLDAVENFLDSNGYKKIDTLTLSQNINNKKMQEKTYWVDDGSDKSQSLPGNISAEIIVIGQDGKSKIFAQYGQDQNMDVKKGAWMMGDYDISTHKITNQKLIDGLQSIILIQ